VKVYILDEQNIDREQLIAWLSESVRMTEIEVFEDHIQFIKRTWKFPPHWCFIRLGHDQIPGLKTARAIKTNPDIRIVFISDDRHYALDAHEIGAYGYLLCPVERDRLKKCLG